MKVELLKAIAVTAELTGTSLSEGAAKVFAEDLAKYPHEQVIRSLARCRREVKGRLTLNDVITRLDDGRPGVEEAWAMIPKDERDSVYWTDEMAKAFGVASALLAQGDDIAARMAFKEVYQLHVQRARDKAEPVRWRPSWGHDPAGRIAAVTDAEMRGLITTEGRTYLTQIYGGELESDSRTQKQLDDYLDRAAKKLASPAQPREEKA